MAMVLAMVVVGLVGLALANATIRYVDDDGGTDSGACTSLPSPCKTITYAISQASAGDTIEVAAGTYDMALGESFPIVIDKTGLTLKSTDGAATTIINSLGTTVDVPPWYGIIVAAIKVDAANVTIGGSGFHIIGGRPAALYVTAAGGVGLTVKDNLFQTNQTGESRGIYADDLSGALIEGNEFSQANPWSTTMTPGSPGTAMVIANADTVTITNNIAYNVKYGFLTFTPERVVPSEGYTEHCTEATAVIKDVTVTGNQAYDIRDRAVRFHICTKDTDHLVPHAQDLNIDGPATLSGNDFYDNGWGVYVDALGTSGVYTGTVSGAHNIAIHLNNIYGNTNFGVWNGQTDVVDAENNWWGANDGPSASPGSGDKISDNVDADPWLVLNISANPVSIVADGNTRSTITADMTRNSDGADTSGLGYIPDGTEINFATNRGSIGSLTTTKTTTNGTAQATLTSSTTAGTATVTASAPPHTAGATATTHVQFRPGEPYTLTVTADPTSVPADGTSSSTITATVLDGHGNNVANGTQVLFSTDLGSLDSLGSTQVIKTTTNGIATATLTSGTVAGTATVTGFSAGVSDQTVVEFTWPYHLYLPLIVKSYTP